ncbi:MAG: BspA family leucine-rich repeat surface protein [Pedobacter sp.]|nr:MAG: BspA family leucine-rich repeat surface protein [Pedobacter sp.]
MRKFYFFFLLLTAFISNAQQPFITTWEVQEDNDNTTTDFTIYVPIYGSDNNYTVDFGDGIVLENQTGGISHTYNNPGVYTVILSGNFTRIYFGPFGSSKLKSIDQWGDIQWSSMESAFKACKNLVINATDTPDLSQVTDARYMFSGCWSMNQPLNSWDVSNIERMDYMFAGTLIFNQPLDNWDVSHVTNMHEMFAFTEQFNQSLENWDVSSVTDMSRMFYQAAGYNSSITGWDVSNVTTMNEMFKYAGTFNQPLNDWDVSSVTHMEEMFSHAIEFDQSLNSWDVSNVTIMAGMFSGATAFNGEISNWNVSNVTDMNTMFSDATSFNKPLNYWDISNVIYINDMFSLATSFNQPLNSWDISNIYSLNGFLNAAYNFNQDLSEWDFSNPQMFNFINNSGLDTNNYDKLLRRFAQLGIENITLRAYGLKYCDFGVRDYLIENLNCNISYDSLGEDCIGNTLSGNVTLDINSNGCDDSEIVLNNLLVSANNGSFNYGSFTSESGGYNLNIPEGSYTFGLTNVPDYFTVSPQQSTISFEDFGSEETINFCLTANEAVNDLNITLLPITEARPGFEASYQLVAENMGTQAVIGASISLSFDPAMQTYASAVPSPAAVNESVLIFSLPTLAPLSRHTVNITMQTFTPPTVNGGDVLNFTAIITPDDADNTPVDNTFELAQMVVNSFDPNDKQVLQGEEVHEDRVGEYLDYIIRFQNTGSASAINVRIADDLDAKLDWTTLKPLSASHSYSVEITDGNHVEFIFNGINLPHEEADAPGSNGFIAYKIKPLQTIQVGDIISGDAAIYFDYNLPIITNTVATVIVEDALSTPNPKVNRVSVYPNPASTTVFVKTNNNITIEKVELYNMQGAKIISINGNLNNVDITSLQSGVYLMSVTTAHGLSKFKLIKK